MKYRLDDLYARCVVTPSDEVPPTLAAFDLSVAAALRRLAETPAGHIVLEAGVNGSAMTLDAGVFQRTDAIEGEALRQKHRARLRSALREMAEAIEQHR